MKSPSHPVSARQIAVILGSQAVAMGLMMLASAALFKFSAEPQPLVENDPPPAEKTTDGSVSTVSLDLSLNFLRP